jgi:hypothetical protein
MKRTILVGLLVCLGLHWLWPLAVEPREGGELSSKSQPATRGHGEAPRPGPLKPEIAKEVHPGEMVEFPSIGKVKIANAKETTVNWKDADGKGYSLPFRFQFADNGVWVRAIYRGPGVDYPEDTPKKLEGLYGMRGDKVMGIPDTPPATPLAEILANAHDRVRLEKASKIVLEHLVIDHSPDVPPEPAVMVKVWGVEKPWADSPDTIPRIALTYYLITGYGKVDNAL